MSAHAVVLRFQNFKLDNRIIDVRYVTVALEQTRYRSIRINNRTVDIRKPSLERRIFRCE